MTVFCNNTCRYGFSLEETNCRDQAEEVSKNALFLQPLAVWATHTICEREKEARSSTWAWTPPTSFLLQVMWLRRREIQQQELNFVSPVVKTGRSAHWKTTFPGIWPCSTLVRQHLAPLLYLPMLALWVIIKPTVWLQYRSNVVSLYILQPYLAEWLKI